MSIQLPCDFAVPNLGEIKVTNLVPGLTWRPPIVYAITVPINILAIVKIVIPQQIEAVEANPFRAGDNFLSLFR